jgi:hypothetical protein
MDWLGQHSDGMMVMLKDIQDLANIVFGQTTTITTLKDWIGELELGHHVLRDRVTHIEDAMDVDLPIINLTDSNDEETTNKSSSPGGSSSDVPPLVFAWLNCWYLAHQPSTLTRGVMNSPSWPCFWSSSFFFLLFAPSSHNTQSRSARERQQKTSYKR